MFAYTSLASFNGDLSSLVSGYDMFKSTSLDKDSLEIILDTLPNWKDNPLMTYEWDYTKGEYIVREFNNNKQNLAYPIVEIVYNNTGILPIRQNFSMGYLSPSDIAYITITYNDEALAALTDDEKAKITAMFEEVVNTKGWTIETNAELGGTHVPTVAAADGTIQRYIYAIKREATEDTASYIDADGNFWTLDTAECIIGPKIQYWTLFATVEDAINEWNLTKFVKEEQITE
jgi:hypothetical protein